MKSHQQNDALQSATHQRAPASVAGEANARFCWIEDADAVIVKSQAAVAVYVSTTRAIVVRQQQEFLERDDHVIVIPADRARAVADAILAAATLAAAEPANEPGDHADSARPRDTTAAERQRRYRQRQAGGPRNGADRDDHRNVTLDDAVTHRDGDASHPATVLQ